MKSLKGERPRELRYTMVGSISYFNTTTVGYGDKNNMLQYSVYMTFIRYVRERMEHKPHLNIHTEIVITLLMLYQKLTPTYELELPSTKKKIKYRPFLVKKRNSWFSLMESEDTKQITTSNQELLKSYILTRGVKVEVLPTFDIEFLFLNIRAKSVGEVVELKLICPDDRITEVDVELDIEEIRVQEQEGHNKTIILDDNLRMDMKYPLLNNSSRTTLMLEM